MAQGTTENVWIWSGHVKEFGTTGTTEFPDKLTHSYYVDKDPFPMANKENRTLLFGSKENEWLLSFTLFLSLISNMVVVGYQSYHAYQTESNNIKILRRWIRISTAAAQILVTIGLIASLAMDTFNHGIPMWLATQWHVNHVICLQILITHGLLVLANKWIQAGISLFGEYNLVPFTRKLSLAIFVLLWIGSLFGGHINLLYSINYDLSKLLEKAHISYFNDTLASNWTSTIVLCSVSIGALVGLSLGSWKWSVFVDPKPTKEKEAPQDPQDEHDSKVANCMIPRYCFSTKVDHSNFEIPTSKAFCEICNARISSIEVTCPRGHVGRISGDDWRTAENERRRSSVFQNLRCCSQSSEGKIYQVHVEEQNEMSDFEEEVDPKDRVKKVQFVMGDLIGQVPENEVFEPQDMDSDTGIDLAHRKSASADLVRGRMFDVLFEGNQQNEELSAANLRVKMQQIITQASIEEIEEKSKKYRKKKRPKLVNTKRLSKKGYEDPHKIDSSKVESHEANLNTLRRERSVIEPIELANDVLCSFDDDCSLPMKHRHPVTFGEPVECSADLHEFRVSLILTATYNIALNIATIIFCVQYEEENYWHLEMVLQIFACLVHPLLEFLLSARVRFFVMDIFRACDGEFDASDEVIVT